MELDETIVTSGLVRAVSTLLPVYLLVADHVSESVTPGLVSCLSSQPRHSWRGSPVHLTSGCSFCSVLLCGLSVSCLLLPRRLGMVARASSCRFQPRGGVSPQTDWFLFHKCDLLFRLTSKCLFLVKKLVIEYFSHF